MHKRHGDSRDRRHRLPSLRASGACSVLVGAVLLLVACAGDGQAPLLTDQPPEPRQVENRGGPAAWRQPAPEFEPPLELSGQELIDLGRDLYAVYCAACHQMNGEGNLGRFPALNGNAFVRAEPPTALLDTVLHGRRTMPAFGLAMSSTEIAAILSYIRNAWSNNAPVIHPTQVQEARATQPAAPE